MSVKNWCGSHPWTVLYLAFVGLLELILLLVGVLR